MVDSRVVRFAGALLALVSWLAGGCSGDDGKDGASCTVTVDEEAQTTTVTCSDGTEAVIPNGHDGASCTVEDNGDGTKTITCDDGTTVTVEDGTPGEDGTDPEPCTVEDNGDGTKTVTCGEDSIVVSDGIAGLDGIDGSACTVVDNGDGSHTITCEDGTTVTITDGENGENGLGILITDSMGTEYLQTSGEFAEGKFFADAEITAATADVDGVVTVDFTVTNADGVPVLNLPSVAANIVKLVPAADGDASNRWVSYNYRTQTIVDGDWPNPAGTAAVQAYRENNGTLTDHGDGTYTYVFATVLTNVTGFDGAPVTYDRSLKHRVSIMMGGHSGATADAIFDFVPDGSVNDETRDIVRTEVCQSCHGWDFHGHGGDRLTVENCATCHVPGSIDPNGGESLDLREMIHKIHAGSELATIPGADGIVFDDPATVPDESADNGSYRIWGNGNSEHDWGEGAFPAVLENCTKCHQQGSQAENWRENPSRAACGSCHDDVDFATGENHAGGIMDNDDNCTLCHRADGGGLAPSVTEAHAWIANDPRKQSEFDVALTVSTPANGEFFVDGETPVVSIALRDAATGVLLDHTTVAEDATSEGCTLVDANNDGVWDACPARDGLFRSASLFVSGPRANRVPVLTTAARAAIVSAGTGPFDLSAANASLTVTTDAGRFVQGFDGAGGDVRLAGTFTVNVSAGTFVSTVAATTDEIVTWLNANAGFRARAIAYNQSGRVGIRSRNLGPLHAIQLSAGAVTTAVFGGDVTAHLPIGSTTSNNVMARTNPANNDPKATRNVADITYTLDPVDDLEPGTYIASVEITDAGSNSDTDYRTPTVGRVTFQVGVADEEPLIARNCSTCHQGPDGGYTMDFRRHHKDLNDTAIDQCGACHDYQPQNATSAGGGSWGWTGSRPINRRVHGVHNGSALNTPLATVDYQNGDPVRGRNWNITLPQDVRNCETCHTAETSGTWATNPARLPCSGCHDSEPSLAHMRQQTFDPTPADPWSGDEQESCIACHSADAGGLAEPEE